MACTKIDGGNSGNVDIGAKADKYRARGLTGQALDVAIVSNLPRRLAQLLEGTTYH